MNEHSIAVLEYHRILEVLAATAQLAENRPLLLQPDFPCLEEIHTLLERTGELLTLISVSGMPPAGSLPPLAPVLEPCRLEGALLPPESLRTAALWAQAGHATADYLQAPESGGNASLAKDCRVPTRLYQHILKAITPEGTIDDAAFPLLRRIRADIIKEQEALDRALMTILHKPAHSALFQEKLVTLRDGRFVLPLKSGKKGKIPGLVHGRSSSGGTLFLEPLEAVERNNRINDLFAEEQECINQILRDFTASLREELPDYWQLHSALLKLDRLAARARLALEIRGVRPTIGNDLDLIQARHPLLEVTPIPIDIRPGDKPMMVITGPNTGGKTVGLKTAGLLIMMAMAGLYIPAEERSRVPFVEDILCDIGDEQSIRGNLSTFSGHINHIKTVLKNANSRSLILLDEPGAGTDPQEGAALAQAILEELLKSGATVLVSTHYHELKYFAFKHPRIVSASVAFDPDTFAPGYTILTGQPGASRALEIARNLGLSATVLNRAMALLGPESERMEGVLQALQKELAAAEAERAAAAQHRKESETLKQQYEQQLARAEMEKTALIKKTRDSLEKSIREYAVGMDELLKQLKDKEREPDAREKSDWKKTAREIAAHADSALPQPLDGPGQKETMQILPGPIAIGDRVLIRRLDRQGEVLSLGSRGKKATVRHGETTTILPTEDLLRLKGPEKKEKNKKNRTGRIRISVDTNAEPPPLTLDIRGVRYEEAIEKIREYIDQAALRQCPQVTIIHGKGTGALQQASREVLQSHPLVNNFEYSSIEAGGTGSTVVRLS